MDDGIKRNEKGQFVEGTQPGPGRTPGLSLKEFWRKRFQEMTDEEKLEFTKKVGLNEIWRMAEGNPENKSDVTSGGEKLPPQVIVYGETDPLRKHLNGENSI